MNDVITVEAAQEVTLAAVRAAVPREGIPAAWKPALDKVWAFLRTNQIPNAGLNVFLYQPPQHSGGPMNIDFGVQVLSRFQDEGEVKCVATPSGQVVKTIHIGPYTRLREAHAAIHQWCKANQRRTSTSWEIYGHWNNDQEKLETTICYLLD
jgi:effector-binding domain-containing protein